MTATAIATLVEDEKLLWASIVSDVLPDFKHNHANIRQHCTITNLLSHTSGLGGNSVSRNNQG
jgi:CubicO group peptidase (beta-lactamase class C family)